MGYSTDFEGQFKFNKTLDDETFNLLKGLATTRRMGRNVGKEFGEGGEFYVGGEGDFGQNRESDIIDYNTPPKTQPGLWLGWIPTEDKNFLEWDEGEKFYNYLEWLEYIINKILIPRGYTLNGVVFWSGDEPEDLGKIIIIDNKITIKRGYIAYR